MSKRGWRDGGSGRRGVLKSWCLSGTYMAAENRIWTVHRAAEMASARGRQGTLSNAIGTAKLFLQIKLLTYMQRRETKNEKQHTCDIVPRGTNPDVAPEVRAPARGPKHSSSQRWGVTPTYLNCPTGAQRRPTGPPAPGANMTAMKTKHREQPHEQNPGEHQRERKRARAIAPT